MTREKGIEKVKQYDHVKPRKDLERWLKYVDCSERKFDEIADSFRDPRVWSIIDGEWYKMDITGEYNSYGSVCLPKDKWNKYIKK